MKGNKQALEWQICIKVLSATHYLLVSPSHMSRGLPSLARQSVRWALVQIFPATRYCILGSHNLGHAPRRVALGKLQKLSLLICKMGRNMVLPHRMGVRVEGENHV